jgi:hypothetical protein
MGRDSEGKSSSVLGISPDGTIVGTGIDRSSVMLGSGPDGRSVGSAVDSPSETLGSSPDERDEGRVIGKTMSKVLMLGRTTLGRAVVRLIPGKVMLELLRVGSTFGTLISRPMLTPGVAIVDNVVGKLMRVETMVGSMIAEVVLGRLGRGTLKVTLKVGRGTVVSPANGVVGAGM